ncbi:MAG: valine--tRNA ligase [Nitrospirae bacterium]|nr:valine--tRNA ligase [Nitrospirota bacterium]
MKEFNKSYDPKGVEDKWYQFWIEKGYFHADEDRPKFPFCIVIPPPNITGSLHLGHALNNTLQDILIRWKRMDGYNALWLPGTDHAGIATQNVIEKQLKSEGTDRHALGRDNFVKRVWQWKEEYGGRIIHQLKRLGASCDWQRERFTMDEGLSRAVREVFVRLYEEGLIYKGDYIINWCPRCRTALSDLEVEHEEVKGKLYYIRYTLTGKGNPIIVATTRPETMLGDTAVAVHPEDERYRGLIGRKVLLPIAERFIPIISDPFVNREFGTGAVKVTPAHDPNDFEIGLRHNLPALKIMDEEGKMNEEAGGYAGQDRFECRKNLLKELKAGGYIERIQDYTHSIGHCYRCRTPVEPYLSKQWFVKMKGLAEPAIEAVKKGRIRLIPKGWENSYFDWMLKIKDWCISRQIWWGHRIPAWHCEDCGGITVDRVAPAECRHCKSKNIKQEEDVLDTWFSSAIWPFSTLGWPEDTKELRIFYPTTTLVTSFDILFFWVARMIMMGLKFMGNIPFSDVYIHALVRDAEGQKMSKSKGNIIDPLVMINKYGTDAFRFTLTAFAAQGRDIRFSEERVEGYRHFCNKIWNASRFVFMNIEDSIIPPTPPFNKGGLGGITPSSLPNRWILSRLNHVIREIRKSLEDYRFNDAAGSIYQFVWHEFCDWYLEMAKSDLSQDSKEKEETLNCLIHTLDHSLRLLHPFMPFITEEIWQHLPVRNRESITISEFPKEYPDYYNTEAEEEMSLVILAVMGIRNIRGEMNISPSIELKAIINVKDDRVKETLERNLLYIERFARGKEIKIGKGLQRPKMAATSISEVMEIYIPLEGILDIDGERSRLKKDLDKAEKDIAILSKKLTNEDFLSKAPKEVVNKDKSNYNTLTEKAKRLKDGIKKLKLLEKEAAL